MSPLLASSTTIRLKVTIRCPVTATWEIFTILCQEIPGGILAPLDSLASLAPLALRVTRRHRPHRSPVPQAFEHAR